VDDGDDRFVYGRKSAEHLVDALFIGHPIVSAEAAELCDIRTCYESAPACAAQHEGAKVRIGVDLGTGIAEPLVHLEGHRIACLGPVEGAAQTASDYFGEHSVAHVCSSFPAPTDAEEFCGDCVSLAYSSDSTLSVSAPSDGPAAPSVRCDREKRIGLPNCVTSPRRGCWEDQKKFR